MIGERIKSIRLRQGVTQSVLAEHIGVSKRTLCRWEGGECVPDAESVSKIAQYLEVDINELVSEDIYDKDLSNKKPIEDITDKVNQVSSDISEIRVEMNSQIENVIDNLKLERQQKIRNILIVVFGIIIVLLLLFLIWVEWFKSPDYVLSDTTKVKVIRRDE